MSLEIEQRDREGISLLVFKGRLVLGDESETFRDRTRALYDTGQRNLILNMLDVDHIDSTGLGELVSLAQLLQRDSGRVKLVELNQKNVELLVITKLSTVFEMYDDEQDAVNSFFPDRQVKTFDLLTFVQEIKDEKD